MGNYVDFDKFLSEREKETKTVKIFGRKCKVLADLPFIYMMKAIALSKEGKRPTATMNLDVLKHMFAPDDFEYISTHFEFTLPAIRAIIEKIWMSDDEEESNEPEEITEDDLAIQNSGIKKPKKA